MQTWQIAILKLEQTALGQLDEFIAHHKLGVFVAATYLLMAFGVGFIALIFRGQRRRPRQSGTRIPPVIVIEMPAPPPPPPPDTFDPFPPPHYYRHHDCDEFDRD